MYKITLARKFAIVFQAYLNCIENDNAEWERRWWKTLERLASDLMPSGSGFDNGTEFDIPNSEPNRLVFTTSYHHMDSESGMYTGWTSHEIIVTPDLASDFNLEIKGEERDDNVDNVPNEHAFIGDEMYNALAEEYSIDDPRLVAADGKTTD